MAWLAGHRQRSGCSALNALLQSVRYNDLLSAVACASDFPAASSTEKGIETARDTCSDTDVEHWQLFTHARTHITARHEGCSTCASIMAVVAMICHSSDLCWPVMPSWTLHSDRTQNDMMINFVCSIALLGYVVFVSAACKVCVHDRKSFSLESNPSLL